MAHHDDDRADALRALGADAELRAAGMGTAKGF
jgi:hypothetical protein